MHGRNMNTLRIQIAGENYGSLHAFCQSAITVNPFTGLFHPLEHVLRAPPGMKCVLYVELGCQKAEDEHVTRIHEEAKKSFRFLSAFFFLKRQQC